MAGHSKWANIQHRKGKQDKLRSKMFSKLAKETFKVPKPYPSRKRRKKQQRWSSNLKISKYSASLFDYNREMISTRSQRCLVDPRFLRPCPVGCCSDKELVTWTIPLLPPYPHRPIDS